jgi:6-phosphogluconolactonase
MKNFGQIRIFHDKNEWYEMIINDLYYKIDKIVCTKGKAVVALSGGSTPYPIYKRIASDVINKPRISTLLKFVDFILVDERPVTLDHPDSNGGKLLELWSGLPLRFHLIDDNIEPFKAALEYEKCIIKLLGNQNSIDIILLGMGADGHTASLFTESQGLNELNSLFFVNQKKDGSIRFTLSLKALNEANERIVMLSGKEKMDVFKAMISCRNNKYPIEALMVEQSTTLQWFFLIGND